MGRRTLYKGLQVALILLACLTTLTESSESSSSENGKGSATSGENEEDPLTTQPPPTETISKLEVHSGLRDLPLNANGLRTQFFSVEKAFRLYQYISSITTENQSVGIVLQSHPGPQNYLPLKLLDLTFTIRSIYAKYPDPDTETPLLVKVNLYPGHNALRDMRVPLVVDILITRNLKPTFSLCIPADLLSEEKPLKEFLLTSLKVVGLYTKQKSVTLYVNGIDSENVITAKSVFNQVEEIVSSSKEPDQVVVGEVLFVPTNSDIATEYGSNFTITEEGEEPVIPGFELHEETKETATDLSEKLAQLGLALSQEIFATLRMFIENKEKSLETKVNITDAFSDIEEDGFDTLDVDVALQKILEVIECPYISVAVPWGVKFLKSLIYPVSAFGRITGSPISTTSSLHEEYVGLKKAMAKVEGAEADGDGAMGFGVMSMEPSGVNFECKDDSYNSTLGHLIVTGKTIVLDQNMFLRTTNPNCKDKLVESVGIFATHTVTLSQNLTITMTWDSGTRTPDGIQEIAIVTPNYVSANFTIHLLADDWNDNWCIGGSLNHSECLAIEKSPVYRAYNITNRKLKGSLIVVEDMGTSFEFPRLGHDGLPTARLLFVAANISHNSTNDLFISIGGKPGKCRAFDEIDYGKVYKESKAFLIAKHFTKRDLDAAPCSGAPRPPIILPNDLGPTLFIHPDAGDATVPSGVPGIFTFIAPDLSLTGDKITNTITLGPIADTAEGQKCKLFEDAEFDEDYCEKTWEGIHNPDTGDPEANETLSKPYAIFDFEDLGDENIKEKLDNIDLDKCKIKHYGKGELEELWYCLPGRGSNENRTSLTYTYPDFSVPCGTGRGADNWNPVTGGYDKYFRYISRYEEYMAAVNGEWENELQEIAFLEHIAKQDDFIRDFITPKYFINCNHWLCKGRLLDTNRLIVESYNLTEEPPEPDDTFYRKQLAKILILEKVLHTIPEFYTQTQFKLTCTDEGQCTCETEKCSSELEERQVPCLLGLDTKPSDGEIKMVLQLNTALLGRQYYLKSRIQGEIGVNVELFLEATVIILDEFKKVQQKSDDLEEKKRAKEALVKRAEKMQAINDEFGAEIDKKVEAGITAIRTQLAPVINDIVKMLEGLLGDSIQSILAQKDEQERLKEEYKQKIKEARKALEKKKLYGWLNFFASLVSIVSPAAGMALQVGINVAQTLTGEGTVSDKITKAVNFGKESGGTIEALINKKKGSYGPFRDLYKKADGLYSRVKNEFNGATKKYDGILNGYKSVRKNFEREINSAIPNIKRLDDYRKQMSDGFNALQGLVGSSGVDGIEANSGLGAIAGKLASYSKVGGLLSAGMDLASSTSEDDDEIREMQKVVEGAEARIRELDQLEYEVYDTFLPMISSIKSFVSKAVNGAADNKNLAEISTNQWKIKDSLATLKYKFTEFLKRLGDDDLKAKLDYVLERLDLALSAVFQIFRDIENYQSQKRMADYMYALLAPDVESIQLPPMPSKEEMFFMEIKNRTQLYFALWNYQKALKFTEFYVFPFAKNFADLSALTLDNTKGLVETMEQAITNVRQIEARFKQERSVIKEGDNVRATEEFYFERETTEPFFVWCSAHYREEIKRLLRGEEVVFIAQVSASAEGVEAIKFTELDLEFLLPEEYKVEFAKLLKKVQVKMTHSGSNYFRLADKYYLLTSPEFSLRFGFEVNKNGDKSFKDANYELLSKGNAVLSPYTEWRIQLYHPRGKDLPDFSKFFEMDIDMGLSGVASTINTWIIDFDPSALNAGWYYPEAPPIVVDGSKGEGASAFSINGKGTPGKFSTHTYLMENREED